MPPEKSPCLECELLHQDKDNPICEECGKRIEYVTALGVTCNVPIELTDLTAKKGTEMRTPAEKPQKTQTGPIRICEDCKEKPTLHPNSKLCATCMAKRSHKNKKRPESAFKAAKKKKPYTYQAKSPPTPQGPSGAIVIEFKSHTSVLKEVEKLAEQEMRPLDCQVLYMLKKIMESEVQ